MFGLFAAILLSFVIAKILNFKHQSPNWLLMILLTLFFIEFDQTTIYVKHNRVKFWKIWLA